MKRRSFIKLTGAAGIITLMTPGAMGYASPANATLDESFTRPPFSARPFTWWHWMNGNVTKEGITLDLEAMKRVGIGGVQCFNVGSGIPKGPVDYLGETWLDLTKHAIREAARLGLEFDMHNCPGWSSTGGPWITPELSMQQVVWSETMVQGGTQIRLPLPKPFSKLECYKDIFVLAFPTLPGEETQWHEKATRVSTPAGAINAASLAKADLGEGIDFPSAQESAPQYLVIEFSAPFQAQSFAVFSTTLPATVAGSTSNVLQLECSSDGTTFRPVTEIRRVGNNVEMPAAASFPPVSATCFRLKVSQPLRIAGIRLSPAPRLENWTYKANFPGSGGSGNPLSPVSDFHVPGIGRADNPSIAPDSVIDISRFMNDKGELDWAAPPGHWTILRLGHTATGRRNNAAPESGAGLECDKFSREAYDFHFNKMFADLLPVLSEISSTVKVGLLVDSYEVAMQNWTTGMPELFRARRGYDFVKYLPAMTGRIVENAETTERFLWDLRRTHADLMAENYHGYFAELCHKHGFLAYTEPYNNGPFEQMEVGAKVDVNMGEFWIRGAHFFPSVKLAASIAHVYAQRVNGLQVVGAESFTGDAVHSKWQESPYALKAQGDYMFTKGLTRFIFHRYAHQPHPTAKPGMTMGPWGFHFDRTNTWFEKSQAWLNYASRCQSMLQQGKFVADLLYYTGEDGPGDDFSTIAGPDPAPPFGYDYDFINKAAVLSRLRVQAGQIKLPDGVSYRLFVLHGKKPMSIPVLKKIRELVEAGMILVGEPPAATPGLSERHETATFNSLVTALWAPGVTERRVGSGKVFSGLPLAEVLKRLGIIPDFQCTASRDPAINYIHRTIENADVYFVANRKREPEQVLASFRITGKRPERWDPDTGAITPLQVYDVGDGATRIPLRMEPADAFFIVFRAPAATTRIVRVERDRKLLLSAAASAPQPPVRYDDVRMNFTVTAWIKPETDENFQGSFAVNRGMASNIFYPPEGEAVYGEGHSTAALIAGRNGFMIYERSGALPGNPLIVPMPLSGWTHVAVVYENGAPALHVNGAFVAKGAASGKVVHPGLHQTTQDYYSWFFEGDVEALELHRSPLTNGQIGDLFRRGVPPPEAPTGVWEDSVKKDTLVCFTNGRYDFITAAKKRLTVDVKNISAPVDLSTDWEVSFPEGLGAPEKISLPRLISLRTHADAGVRYFSGTATYTRNFVFPAANLASRRRWFLDLGRVEVLAEVFLNGTPVALLWKPPFRVDVTPWLRPGSNALVVKVTNLWPNRLIGDEQLPPENEYGSAGQIGGTGGASGAIRRLPDWYVENKSKPAGGRVTFSTWKHYQKDSPLLESGLLGPAALHEAVEVSVKA